MINITQAKKYCNEDLSKIENYEKAMADDTQVWVMHHRLETHFSNGDERQPNARLSHKELKALGVYYKRPADELIFVTKANHNKLHFGGRESPNKGNHFTEEQKLELSKLHSGSNNGMFGRKHTEESKRKMRESRLAYLARKAKEG